MGKTSTHCILLLVLFSGPRMVIEAECNGIIKVSSESSGTIQSPNFGAEYGKSANCSWEFTSLSGNKAFLLTLTVTKLKTYVALNGNKVCLGSYNLTINYAPAECTRYADPAYNLSYCIAYYSSSTCASLASSKNCEVSQMTSFPIPVTYISDGRTDDTRTELAPSRIWGFQMQHEYAECPPVPTRAFPYDSTEMTPKKPSLTSEEPTIVNTIDTMSSSTAAKRTSSRVATKAIKTTDPSSRTIAYTTSMESWSPAVSQDSQAAEYVCSNQATTTVAILSTLLVISTCLNVGTMTLYFWRRNEKNPMRSTDPPSRIVQAGGDYENCGAPDIEQNRAYEEIPDKTQYETIGDKSPYANV